MSRWRMVELDFQEIYGIDIGAPGFMRSRSWRWGALRILGLLSTESRVQRVLRPIKYPNMPG